MPGPKDHVSEDSFLQIVWSTLLIGGSSVVNIAFSIIRNKSVAIVLGPEGVGLMGLFGSILDLAQTLAGMGVQASGVRQVAEAAATGEASRVACISLVLNRLSTVLGLAGALLLAALALPVSIVTFGAPEHAVGVALLSVGVFLRVVSAGQVAYIQGLRRVGDLARINMFGAFWSTLACVPIIVVYGLHGIVPALVGMAFVTLLVSSRYSRPAAFGPVKMNAGEARREVASLLKLGVAFMVSTVLTFGSAYSIRLIVLRVEGLEAAGFYQAAWSIGGLYAGFILQAMGADFYPRLTAVCTDNEACNRLVNEQAQVSILLAGPGLLATLTVAPLLMTLLYSSEFHAAADLLRLICVGMMLRIITWPIGYIVIAKGARWIFMGTEIAATVVHVGLAWLLIKNYGLAGTGAAFMGLYVWHGILIYWLARRLTGFRWSRTNALLAVLFLFAATFVFASFSLLPSWQAVVCGTLVTVLSGVFSLYKLLRLLPREKLPFGHRLPQWV